MDTAHLSRVMDRMLVQNNIQSHRQTAFQLETAGPGLGDMEPQAASSSGEVYNVLSVLSASRLRVQHPRLIRRVKTVQPAYSAAFMHEASTGGTPRAFLVA